MEIAEICFRQEREKTHITSLNTVGIRRTRGDKTAQTFQALIKTDGYDTHIHPEVDFDTRVYLHAVFTLYDHHVYAYKSLITSAQSVLQTVTVHLCQRGDVYTSCIADKTL